MKDWGYTLKKSGLYEHPNTKETVHEFLIGNADVIKEMLHFDGVYSISDYLDEGHFEKKILHKVVSFVSSNTRLPYQDVAETLDCDTIAKVLGEDIFILS